MEPNATLERIRELVNKRIENVDALTVEETDELVARVNELDNWLSKGGFIPRDWRPF
jgi:hypothetical protein